MKEQRNKAIINGTSALKLSEYSCSGAKTIQFSECRRDHAVRASRQNINHRESRASRTLGNETVQNLKGTEVALSRAQLALSGIVFTLGGLFIVWLEAVI